MDNQTECRNDEERPQEVLNVGILAFRKVVIIESKFTKDHEVAILERALDGIICGSITRGDSFVLVALGLVFSKQVEAICEHDDSNEQCQDEVLDVSEDFENDGNKRSHFINKLHIIQAFGPDQNGQESFDDALAIQTATIVAGVFVSAGWRIILCT